MQELHGAVSRVHKLGQFGTFAFSKTVKPSGGHVSHSPFPRSFPSFGLANSGVETLNWSSASRDEARRSKRGKRGTARGKIGFHFKHAVPLSVVSEAGPQERMFEQKNGENFDSSVDIPSKKRVGEPQRGREVFSIQKPIGETLKTARNGRQKKRKLPSLTLSLDPSDVNLEELKFLLAAVGQNCDTFPQKMDNGKVVPVDLRKLKRALMHSTVVVSLHARSPFPGDDYMRTEAKGSEPPLEEAEEEGSEGVQGWWQFGPGRQKGPKRLVAFGRAASDTTLTASIHDIAVAPSLQGLGLGKMVLQRIVRELSYRGITDISALMPESQCSYFARRGFQFDLTGAATMMYTRRAERGRPLTLPPPLLPPPLPDKGPNF